MKKLTNISKLLGKSARKTMVSMAKQVTHNPKLLRELTKVNKITVR